MPVEPRTVIVIGTPRSGTSLVAGLAEAIGVDMGGPFKPRPTNPKGSYDHPCFVHLTIRHSEGEDVTDEIVAGVAKYAKPLWGWKSAITYRMLDAFLPHMPNPHLLAVYRPEHEAHALSIQNATKRWRHTDVSMGAAILTSKKGQRAVRKAMQAYAHLPQLSLDFKWAKRFPAAAGRAIAEWLSLPFTQEAKAKCLAFVLPNYVSANHQ